MEQIFSEDAYIIDLSYAASASDIVFELSSILDNEMAKNQKVALKLGNVDLNQSQLLSIRSLISSINSTVAYLETNSTQTELAAINLGIVVSTVKAAPVEQEPVEIAEPSYVPSYEYVKLEDHLPENDENKEEQEPVTEETIKEEPRKHEPVGAEKNADVVLEGFASKAGVNSDELAEEEQAEELSETQTPISELTEEEIILKEESNNDTAITEEQADEIIEAKTEDIQDALDNIYSSEVKLESILENEQEEGSISEERVRHAVLSEEKYTEADFEIDHFSTTYIKQTLRSGQIVNYDGNVVIIGDCHPGSEVVASGDITVWGILSGIAHAGAKGNSRARVRALKMNAIQLRIANCYARKPDGMNTIFPERTSTFTPEEARIINDEIVIFKIND